MGGGGGAVGGEGLGGGGAVGGGRWGGWGKDHEAKVTSLSRGMPPGNKFEFWVSDIAVPGEIPTYMTH